MRAVENRPPVLVWDEKTWDGEISVEAHIKHQIKSRSAYYCRICFSKRRNLADLREHCYNLHSWMMGERADVNTRYIEKPEQEEAKEGH